MASTLAKPPSQQRRLSRSNSVSSSSIVTVQRAASLTSRNGARPPVSGLRPQSPSEPKPIPTNLSGRPISPNPSRRSSSAYARPNSAHGVREGIGNLNRWSQSTVSSKSSSNHNKGSSFSKRLSGSFGSFGGFTGPQTPPPNGNHLAKVRPSPKGGQQGYPKRSPPIHPPPILPPIVTLSSLSHAVDTADSPSTATSATTATPGTAELVSSSTHSSSDPDYFGGKWEARSPLKQRSVIPRTTAALSPATSPSPPRRLLTRPAGSESHRQPTSPVSAPALYSKHNAVRSGHSDRHQTSHNSHSRNRTAGQGSGGAEEESSGSSVRSNRGNDQRRNTPSQKDMLSKALQKANHAVLLDNAQNFEGAMTAYEDACALLEQVMLRSPGPEDRRKLEAVVSNIYQGREYSIY